MDIPPIHPSDRKALWAIHEKLNLSNFVNWDKDEDPCNHGGWNRVACNCTNFLSTFQDVYDYCTDYVLEGNYSRVIYLDISGSVDTFNEISGQIPEAVGALTELRYLDFSSNNMNGTIPDSFKNLKNLRYLDLENNQFTGELPLYFATFEKLNTLKLANNDFQGPIPKEWCTHDPPLLSAEDKAIDNQLSITSNEQICGLFPFLSVRNLFFRLCAPMLGKTYLPYSSYLALRQRGSISTRTNVWLVRHVGALLW